MSTTFVGTTASARSFHSASRNADRSAVGRRRWRTKTRPGDTAKKTLKRASMTSSTPRSRPPPGHPQPLDQYDSLTLTEALATTTGVESNAKPVPSPSS